MDPHKVFTKDRVKFDEDLTELINSAAATASSPGNSHSTDLETPSPSADPRLHNRASCEREMAKRIKVGNAAHDDGFVHANVHSSRRGLLEVLPVTFQSAAMGSAHPSHGASGEVRLHDEVPYLQRTGPNTVPLGKSLKRKADDSATSQLATRRDSATSCGSSVPGSIIQTRVHDKDKSGTGSLRNVVRRQWDSSNDVLSYKQLLENRRKERLGSKVDRYVPTSTSSRSSRPATNTRSNSSFPYCKLPESVRAKILTFLLVDPEAIVIDFTWLRSFVNGHCRVPTVDRTIKDSATATYTVPMEWHQLVNDVKKMQNDSIPFRPALEDRGNKTRKRKAPCRGITTGILSVSRGVHAEAASVFYGNNSFRFPWPSSAWMQLESFLATIGPTNVGMLRSINIHCPLWHRGIKEDFLEGAILDLTSPASRFGVVEPSSRDRLLSAITGSVEALVQAGKLKTFAIDLEHGLNAERWAGSYSNTRRLITLAEADEHVVRKQEGVRLLKSLSESLSILPVVTVHHQAPTIGKHDLSEFRARLASIIREAAKYDWKVDQKLEGRR